MRVVAATCHNYKTAPGERSMGEGQLAPLTISDPQQIFQLAAELGVQVPQAVLPPDAPASDPALAADPVEGFSSEAAIAAHAEKSGKKGRKKKDAPPPAEPAAPVTNVVNIAAEAPTPPAPAPIPVPAAPGVIPGLRIMADAIPHGTGYQPLDPYIDGILAMLCKEYGLADIRLAPKDHPLGFDRWLAAAGTVARAHPPAPGTYVAMRRSRVAAEVTDALRPLCELFVEGVQR
jgi:hypothetical protein